MLGSAKTNLPLPTLTSWVKDASPFQNLQVHDISFLGHFLGQTMWWKPFLDQLNAFEPKQI